VPPSEYIQEIVGDDHEFLDADAAQLFVDLLKHHWNEVGAELRRDVVFDPILLRDENGAVYGNNWAIGFLRGVDMRKEAWSEIVDDDITIFLTPMLRLAYEIDPDALIPDFAGTQHARLVANKSGCRNHKPNAVHQQVQTRSLVGNFLAM
jgi:yecA family protein